MDRPRENKQSLSRFVKKNILVYRLYLESSRFIPQRARETQEASLQSHVTPDDVTLDVTFIIYVFYDWMMMLFSGHMIG